MQIFSANFAETKTTAGMANILRLIRSEMELVEEEFARQASSNVQVISYLGEYLRASGGKRVRPALLILANRAAGDESGSESVIKLATVMEMIHTATLVHDDIIDNAATRRNTVTVNAKFGNQAAVLMGDWLYMSAFETALEERSLEILDILIELTRRMTEGELIQLTMLGRTDISVEDYFNILRRKTAFLFSACCEIGAILADAEPEIRAELKEYGMNLGMAFQLADDVLDFTADKEVLGKASGADLLEGKLTLPLILLVSEDPSVAGLLEDVMRGGEYGAGVRERLLGMVDEAGTLEKTRNTALEYAHKAVKNLELLPETRYGLALSEVPSLMINRQS
ncbi:MAG: polyprenyl synthetase family protein [Acidobacteriota bacterium]|nr:MAG: polyprenyl synthetase family protein [Acidobacteriota bacterium]